MRTHSGEKILHLQRMWKMFLSVCKFTYTYVNHSDKRPYSCTECEKCFAHRADLRRRMQEHTREKPYPDTECGKCFLSSNDLQYHIKHTLEKSLTVAKNVENVSLNLLIYIHI